MGDAYNVYVATWGNPLNWSMVDYRCGDGRQVRSYSSIVCAGDVDKYVIYVLDSVLTASSSGEGNATENVVAKVVEEDEAFRNYVDVHKVDGKVRIEPGGRLCGGDVMQKWRCVVRAYVERLARKMMGDKDADVDVVVTAAMGQLSGWTYEGSYPDAVASELLLGLWGSIEGELNNNYEQLNITLDLTHGINFMPAMALFVLRHLASLALLKGVDRVVIRGFNAMPGTWVYSKVFSETITQIVLPEDPSEPRVRALSMGLVPIFYELCRELFCDQCDDRLLRISMSVDCGNRRVSYDVSGVKYAGLYERLIACNSCRMASNKLNVLMKGNPFNKVGYVISRLVINELNSLRQAVIEAAKDREKEERLEKGVLYAELLNNVGSCVEGDKAVLERHAIAHAGLLKDCVEIRKCGDDYCIEIRGDVKDQLLERLGFKTPESKA